jgi:MFS family permease
VLGSASIAICYALAFVRYNAGAPGLALLDSAIAVGALAGSIAVARSGPERPGLKFLLGVGAFGALFMLVALASSIWFAVVLLALGGVANMWFFIPATTIYQTHSISHVRGRVMAAYAAVSRIAMVIGIVTAGAIADHMSIPLMVAFTGAAAVVLSAVGFTQAALRRA